MSHPSPPGDPEQRSPEKAGAGGGPPTGPRRSAGRTLLRWIVRALAGLLALLVLLVTVGTLWIQSPSGTEFVRQRLLSAIGGAIAGRLEIDRIRLDGFLRVEVTGARLFAPEDPIPVASIAHLDLQVRAAELLGGRIDVPKLLVEGPQVHLIHRAGTTNLALALSPAHPAPAATKATGPRELPHLRIHAPLVELRDGRFDMDGQRPVALDGLHLDATATGSLRQLLVSAALGARLHAPAERSLGIDLRGLYRSSGIQVELLDARTGQSSLTLAGSVTFDLSAIQLNIEELSVAPDDLNTILPQAALLSAVRLQGNATLHDRAAHANLELHLGDGRVQVDASAALLALGAFTDLQRYDLRVGIDHLDPRLIRKGLPAALANLQLRIDGTGLPLTGKADVELDASGSRFEQLPIDRLHLVGQVEGEHARIEQLTLRAAGASASIHGTAGLTGGDLQAELRAPALNETRRMLGSGLHLSLPEITGAADLSAYLTGPFRNPAIRITATSPALAVGDNHIEGLQARVDLRELLPLPLGTFEVSADRIHAAGKDGQAIALTGLVDGHKAAVDAKGTFGDKPVELVVRGDRLSHRGGREEWSLGALQVSALGLSVVATQPAHIGWGPGRVRVADLRLQGVVGQLALDGDVGTAGPVQARVRLTGLDLTHMPGWLVPSELGVAGTVALSADVHGTVAAPDVALHVQLARGKIRQLSGATLEGQLRLVHSRVEALVQAGIAPRGHATVSLHAPWTTSLDALSSRLAERPLDLTISTDHLPLTALHQAAPSLPALEGNLGGRLALTGSIRKPTLQAQWSVEKGRFAGVDNLRTRLGVTLQGSAWSAQLSVQDPHGLSTSATLTTSLALRDLLRNDLRIKQRPVDVTVALNELNLAWLPLLGVGPSDLIGQLAGHFSIAGTLGAPVVNATLHGSGVSAAGRRDLDLLVDVSTADEITLTANAQMAGQPFLDLIAHAQVAAARLPEISPAALEEIPVQLNAEIHPTPLDALIPSAAPSPGEIDAGFRARLGLQLFVAGTANAPRGHLHVALDEARLSGQEVGVFTTDLDYRDALTSLSALFDSRTAGTLHADAVLHANLGRASIEQRGEQALRTYEGPAGQRPTAWRAGLAEVLASPVSLAVDVDNFDLGLSNGFSGVVRNLSGRLDLHLHKSGLLAPLASDGSLQVGSVLSGLSGSLGLTKARFSLIGSGAYSDITLRADGSYPSLRVSELRGKAGEGTFDGHLDLTRTGPQRFQGDLFLNLQKIPVVVDFQTRGLLTVQISGTATGTPGQIDIPELTLSHGHVVIPTQLPRHVQSLDPNPEFELAHQPSSRPAPPKQEQQGTWVVKVDKITIPDDLVVEAPLGTKLTLGAHLELVESPAIATKDEPVRVTGRITIVHGVLSLLKPFDVDEGTITFYPKQLEDPTVEVKAHYDGPDATVHVTLSGTIQNLRKEFSSTPSMSENEILYYLATGQRQSQPQNADPQSLQNQMADAALSALGAAAIGVVQGAVQSVLPSALNPDVLTIETDVAHQGIGRVRAGKYYLNGKLYVGGDYNPAANPALNQNTYEAEAQYHISARNFIRLLVGNEGHHQLDYLYELNFPTKEQKEHGIGK